MDDAFVVNPFLIPITAIVGVFTFVIVKTLVRARVRELEIRERIAMIERGLVPPPEKDPNGFDRAMSRFDELRGSDDDWDAFYTRHRAPARYRTAGVTLMGVGFGLMLLISVAGGAAEAGVGVGGFLVIMGMAFFLNSWLSRGDPVMPPRSSRPPSASSSPTDPPRTP